jgi:hypothetical protein
MNNKFSLNKELKKLDKKNLIKIVSELIKFRKENKEFLEMKLKTENKSYIEEILNYYKSKIDLAFDFNKFSMKNARQVINDFKKISRDEKYLIELMTYYIEKATDFEREYGDMWEAFYTTVENMLRDVIKLLNKNYDLIKFYESRLREVISKSCEGWGHKDILEEMIEDLHV